MSDFLDRLAARAIGSETAGGKTALAPRLPSLFEPLQHAPIMPAFDDGEAAPRQREAVSAATVAPTIAPMRPPQASVVTMTDASRIAPAAVEPVAAPPHAAASTQRTVVQPAPIAAAPTPSPDIERPVASSTLTRPAEVFAPLPVRPRQTRIAAEPPETAVPSQPSSGALLPASTSVFGAAAMPARSGHAAALRTLAAQAGTGSASSEPVVHVSIGRLEVRAAPVTATPARRRDGPQPSSLDDYLRQRGGKVSP